MVSTICPVICSLILASTMKSYMQKEVFSGTSLKFFESMYSPKVSISAAVVEPVGDEGHEAKLGCVDLTGYQR